MARLNYITWQSRLLQLINHLGHFKTQNLRVGTITWTLRFQFPSKINV